MTTEAEEALAAVEDLAHRFATVSDGDLDKLGVDNPAVRAEALAEAERRGLIRPREGRRGRYASTTFEGEM